MAFPRTSPPKRRAFDANAPEEDMAGPVMSERVSHRCEAEGCQLTGSMKVAAGYCCGYHAMANFKDWPAVTEVMNGRLHLVREINIGRSLRMHGGYADVLGGHERAIERLHSGAELDVDELAFLRAMNIQNQAQWVIALEKLLSVYVAKVTSVRQDEMKPVSSRTHTRTPHELLAEKWS